VGQFGHSPGAIQQHAQQLGLDRSQIVAFGDARIEALHQAGELDQPGGDIDMSIAGAGVRPVGWFPGKDGSWLIVASANGAIGNPAWYYNIAAHPDAVQIELDGRKIPVLAEQLHGAERDQAWQQIIATAPRFAQYEQKTDRELPVIRLMPRSGGEAPSA
jgi:deazaflavin-dependent oxidoreductase (nitroreductase family)